MRFCIVTPCRNAASFIDETIFSVVSHELTHMWWGDLVTMAWWNDLWLNESFATFVGHKVVADLMPEWGVWRDFVATLARPFALGRPLGHHGRHDRLLVREELVDRPDRAFGGRRDVTDLQGPQAMGGNQVTRDLDQMSPSLTFP